MRQRRVHTLTCPSGIPAQAVLDVDGHHAIYGLFLNLTRVELPFLRGLEGVGVELVVNSFDEVNGKRMSFATNDDAQAQGSLETVPGERLSCGVLYWTRL